MSIYNYADDQCNIQIVFKTKRTQVPNLVTAAAGGRGSYEAVCLHSCCSQSERGDGRLLQRAPGLPLGVRAGWVHWLHVPVQWPLVQSNVDPSTIEFLCPRAHTHARMPKHGLCVCVCGGGAQGPKVATPTGASRWRKPWHTATNSLHAAGWVLNGMQPSWRRRILLSTRLKLNFQQSNTHTLWLRLRWRADISPCGARARPCCRRTLRRERRRCPGSRWTETAAPARVRRLECYDSSL